MRGGASLRHCGGRFSSTRSCGCIMQAPGPCASQARDRRTCWLSAAIRSRQTRNRTTGLDTFVRTMSTYNVPENTRPGCADAPLRPRLRNALESCTSVTALLAGLLLGEVRLSDPAIRSARFTAPALYTRGASERLVQPGSRRLRDPFRRAVRLPLRGWPVRRGLSQRQCRPRIPCGTSWRRNTASGTRHQDERLAARNLDRLTDDGLLVLATDGAHLVARRLALAAAGLSRCRLRDAVRNIDDDRRLAKPAIVRFLEDVRMRGCAWWRSCSELSSP